MIKTIYANKKKGVQWGISAGKNYSKDKAYPFVKFYLLPTVEYEHYDIGSYEEDESFDINFVWLFWYFSISRYWGNAYKE